MILGLTGKNGCGKGEAVEFLKQIGFKAYSLSDILREELEKQDAFVTASLQEGTPNVLMEALAAGLPVICHAVGGMSFAIDSSCGFKVPLRDRQTSILEIADAISRLVMSPGLLNRLSEGALRRAEALSWDELAREIANAYDAIPLANVPGASG